MSYCLTDGTQTDRADRSGDAGECGNPLGEVDCQGKRQRLGARAMTEKQAIVYKIIEEWWKMYGFAPSMEDVMKHTGDKGKSNIHRIYKTLCELGHCKMIPRKARSIRPSYLRVRDIE